MKHGPLLLLLWLAVNGPAGPSIPFFSNQRDVHAVTAPQNYLVIDEEIWQHARPDLGDLRLYDGENQVAYALTTERGGISSAASEAKILNLGTAAGQTAFDLDTGSIPEYDRVRLRLETRNFVTVAFVSGSDARAQSDGPALGNSTLYDFTAENLGSNSTLKLNPVSFRYLHVRIAGKVRPQDVKGATVFNLQEQKARWTKVGACEPPRHEPRTTLISCYVTPRVPVDRVQLQVDAQQVNFRRSLSIADPQNLQLASGELGRVKITRGGTAVTSEDLAVDVPSMPAGRFTITIDNADNPPLRIAGVQPLAMERRLYFDPQGKSNLTLYYGDSRLSAPVYDYARFFHADAAAALAEMGPASHNSAYTGRPDERPWSERHKAILWIVMLGAVALLALLAIRGLTQQT